MKAQKPAVISRVRRYRIRAVLKTVRREASADGVPVKTVLKRRLAAGRNPEDVLPLTVITQISPDRIDAKLVDQISRKVTARLMRHMAAAPADPKALATEVARQVAARVQPRALPATTGPKPPPPKPKRVSIDNIEGMIDQVLKEQD